MLTIAAGDGRHYATLTETDAGVRVTIWLRLRRAARPTTKRLDEWLLDCPFHLACDAVHDTLQRLPAATPENER